MRPYYEHAGITIYHGDCREILPTVPPATLLLTDPPYGNPSLLHGGGGCSHGRMRGMGRALYVSRRTSEPVRGNEQPFDPSHLLHFPKVILWGGNHFANRLPATKSWLVWDKREGQTSDNNADCEFAWTNLEMPARLYQQLWRGCVRRGEENGICRVHPTQKPVALMRWCIGQARLRDNDLVLDPYIGSGPTLEAAKHLGHRAIGIEIEERYCELAAKRLQQDVLAFAPAADPQQATLLA